MGVVTMLQNMQAKVTAQGEAKEKLFDKYMCYCENADETLAKSIADAETKIPQLERQLKEGAAERKQLESDLKQHKADRAEAVAARDKAKALRATQKEKFGK